MKQKSKFYMVFTIIIIVLVLTAAGIWYTLEFIHKPQVEELKYKARNWCGEDNYYIECGFFRCFAYCEERMIATDNIDIELEDKNDNN